MSAYVVDRNHIRYLVKSAMAYTRGHNGRTIPFGDKRLRSGDYEMAAEIGQELWNENIASVLHRYPDGDVVRFIDRFTSKREAIKQSIAHREKLEQEARP